MQHFSLGPYSDEQLEETRVKLVNGIDGFEARDQDAALNRILTEQDIREEDDPYILLGKLVAGYYRRTL